MKIPSDLFGNTALYLPEDLHKTLEPKQIAESMEAISLAIDKQLTLSHLQLLPSVFFDYPTTLHSSFEAINIQLQQAGIIGETEEHAHLGEREIRNFEKTLLTKLNQSEAAMFRDKVCILQLEE